MVSDEKLNKIEQMTDGDLASALALRLYDSDEELDALHKEFSKRGLDNTIVYMY